MDARRSRWSARVLGGLAACGVAAACAPCLVGSVGATARPLQAPPAQYYVALGASLAFGGGSSGPGHGYVDVVSAQERRVIPGLQEENLACSGDTTTSMLRGARCGQLPKALAFLRSHPGQVAFMTIDLGADDVLGCFSGTAIDVPCFEAGLQRVRTNLPRILAQLRAAAGPVPFLGLTYYDPFLAYWLEGAHGRTTARQSLGLVREVNGTLHRTYRAAGLRTVRGQVAFSTHDFRRVGSFAGQTLPLNVARVCHWTHMCRFGADIGTALTHNGVHPNDTGHRAIASSLVRRLARIRRRAGRAGPSVRLASLTGGRSRPRRPAAIGR